MLIDSEHIIPMTEANQNFSKVARTVDKEGIAVIMKNNRPKYVVMDFNEYDALSSAMQARKEEIEQLSGEILSENLEAFLELAK